MLIVSLSIVFMGLAMVGCAYTLAATLIVRRYLRRPVPPVAGGPGVTILKPLRGAEPGLRDNLASFCAQDYPGPVQILFGVHDPRDPAIEVVGELIARYPDHDLELVIAARRNWANGKIATLAGMAERIRHDVIILADSDIRVGPRYLSTVTASLAQPLVGLVTCLYRGTFAGGLPARLAAMAIDYHFLPGALLGLESGLARPCFGSTIALERSTLAAIGGFEAFSQELADDYAMGAAVRRAGLRVIVPRMVVEHRCTERSFAELVQHELRWARTIRAIDPGGFAGSIVTHPVPLALLALALASFAPAKGLVTAAWCIVATASACRLVLQTQVRRTLKSDPSLRWLGPLRDVLSFAVFAASFFVRAVNWRGKRYRVRADGTLIPLNEGLPLRQG